MNILFLGLSAIESLNSHDMYPELLMEFRRHNHIIYSVTNYERRANKKTTVFQEDGAHLLVVRTLNIQKTNIIEKGFSTILLPIQYKKAIKKYFKNVKFDLILYPTPPITLYSVVKSLKKRFDSKTYLMLKDIFPQNALDIGILSNKGVKKFIFNYFRKKEKKLYKISDCIGCMSPRNVQYILNHNPELSEEKVGLCPNCIDVSNINSKHLDKDSINVIRQKYGLPNDKIIFIYGGNLGKPQGLSFIIKCLESQSNNNKVYFVIVGDGTEFKLVENYAINSKQDNLKVFKRMKKEEFETLCSCCDIGLIFLDYRFTIPNFPSRILSYLKVGLPIFACTDKNTDIGEVIMNNDFGWWCCSNNVENFNQSIHSIIKNDIKNIKEKEREFLKNNYSIKVAYKMIVERL